MLARHGQALAEAAEAAGVALRFEAAVAGGIPVVKALTEGLAGNRDHPADGGAERHLQLHPDPDGGRGRALCARCSRRRSGSATPRPTRPSTWAAPTRRRSSRSSPPSPSARRVDFDGISVEGIERVSLADIEHAAELGYRIRLLGVARMTEEGLEARMQPCLVPAASPPGQLTGVTNMVVVEGDFVGRIVMSGPGAGAGPTASAIVGDIIDIARGLRHPALRAAGGEPRRGGARRGTARRRPTTCASW